MEHDPQARKLVRKPIVAPCCQCSDYWTYLANEDGSFPEPARLKLCLRCYTELVSPKDLLSAVLGIG